MSPAAAALEEAAASWCISLLGLPPQCAAGFTTGATMANVTALAAARHALLERAGWDLAERGLQGAPAFTIIVGEEVHVSVLKALALLGFGRASLRTIPVDSQGRVRPDAFPTVAQPAIVCLQAGNVNTGSFDPLRELCTRAHAAGAWVHIDGAFGLWGRASAKYRALADGAELADSWATDAHKWLNVPYDSGIAIVRDAGTLRKAMSHSAAYLAQGELRDGAALVPEFSRRARGIEAWAALRSLGRQGIADLVGRCCRLALRFADAMRAAGFEVLNEVVLNQVLVSFGPAERTDPIVAALQKEGTCWCGATTWQGRRAMRLSVSSWATTEADIDLSIDAVLRVANSGSGS
jgi:glutamate/tyrosine decarboxylase-like PLP-dependent enzyme